MNEQLRKSILQTLAYFDVFDYPLTAEELYRWLYCGYTDNADIRISFRDFFDQLAHFNQIECKDSFYFLPGRADIVEIRQRAVPVIEEKYKIARRAVKKMRWIPFCQAVFLCNTVASSHASPESDIDVFIVVKSGRIWTARFLIILVLALFRLRITKQTSANKICLSFYTTDKHLDLSDVTIDREDIYMMYWIDQLVPVYDPEDMQQKIIDANVWVQKYIPHALQSYKTLHRLRVGDMWLQKVKKKSWEWLLGGGLGSFVEKILKKKQIQTLKANFGDQMNDGSTHVVVNDTMLKFHDNDRREYFREEWQKRLAELGIIGK